MMPFREFYEIHEEKYPLWVKVLVVSLTMKIRKLAVQIPQEKDPVKQNKLIALQNKYHAYISGLSVAVSKNDKKLIQRLRTLLKH